MKLLWLIKRWTMGQDAINQRFGRYYHLPLELSKMNHQVFVLSLDYHRSCIEHIKHGNVNWKSVGGLVRGTLNFIRHSKKIIENLKPDWLVGATDMQFCIAAAWLGRRYQIPVVQDIYDDFETFASGRIFKLTSLFYKALNSSQCVSAFHTKLSCYLQKKAAAARHTVVPNAVAPELFHPLNKAQCRQELNLPSGIPLIGYFGAIKSQQALATLYKAFNALQLQFPQAKLLMAGKKAKGISLQQPGIHYMGFVSHAHMPRYINACDLLTILCYKQLKHLSYSLPMKSIEYRACQVPFVAPRIGALPAESGIYPHMLYQPNDARDLYEKMTYNLSRPRPNFAPQPSWHQIAQQFDALLRGKE